MVAGGDINSLVIYAQFPHIWSAWVFHHYPATTDIWDYRLVGIKSRFAISPDALGIFYLMAPVDTRDHWIDCDGDSDRCVNCGGINFVGGAKIIAWTHETHGRMIIRPYMNNLSSDQLIGFSCIYF